MRHKMKLFSKSLMSSMFFSTISSLTLLFCIALQNIEGINKWLVVGIPVLFWIGLVLEQFFLWRANAIRRGIEGTGKFERARGRPGIISFFQNHPGAVCDVLLGVSFLCLIFFMIFHIGENSIQFLFITFLVLTFRFHCILNGRNYKYKNYLEKRKVRNDEQKH